MRKEILSIFLILFCFVHLFAVDSTTNFCYGNLRISIINGEVTILKCESYLSNSVSKGGIDSQIYWYKNEDNEWCRVNEEFSEYIQEYAVMIPGEIAGFPVTKISDGAFMSCDASIIRLPSSIRKIGKEAFYSSKIKEIQLPDFCILEDGAFMSCKNLVTVSGKDISLGKSVFSCCQKLKNVEITGITSLKEDTFCNCVALERITLPEIQRFEDGVFEGCINLFSIEFPENVSFSGERNRTFYNCESLPVEFQMELLKKYPNLVFYEEK